MKIQLQIAAFLMVFLMIPGKQIFAENYHIAGYVLQENDSTPIHDEIVEIRDQFGANIGSFLTNNHGLYSGTFEVSAAYSPFVMAELSRHCGDSIYFYKQEIVLDNPYLTCNFVVCYMRPCHANFSYLQIALDSLAFKFTDVSVGNITEWFWDFDDQTYSTEQNPTHEFEQPGTYHVKLSINGATCNDQWQNILHAHFGQECVPQFSYQQMNQEGNLMVNFYDESLGNFDEWFWDFDDGETSNEQNPIHQYNQSGEYEVKLSIFGQGCMNNTHQPVIVETGPECFALFNTYQQQSADLKIEFIDLSIGQAETWLWDFGDGNVSNLQNPFHIYENPGDFDVTLTVSNANCDDSFTRSLHVNHDTTCQANFDYQQNSILEPVIQFINLSVGENQLFFWNFGDGTASQETSPAHEFPSSGFYDVMLKTIGFGCSDSLTRQIEVLAPIPCEADFSFTSQSPEALEISFTNQSSGAINSFAWDFGDGSFSIEENPVHTYSQPGIYFIELAVFAVGCADSIQKSVEITEPVFCEAAFTIEQEYPQSRLVSFVNLSVGNNLSSSWDFGDGTFSTANNPQYEYTAPGSYAIKLIISTTDFCSDSLSQNLEILPPFVLSGSVMAGANTLKLGNVLLYKKEVSGQLTIFDQSTLETGSFTFEELHPGNYFVQAIPDLNFPFPVIPNYFPTYAGEKTNWPEAMIFETSSLPESIEINLLHFDDFFDGQASISGKIVLTQGSQDFPVIIYLTDEMNTLLSYKIPDEQNGFEFSEIPYGNYNVYPEKAGKTGQAFSVELTEAKPGSHGIIFNETETAIIPDLTAIDDLAKSKILLSPNPASDIVRLQIKNAFQNRNHLTIYKYDKSVVARYAFSGSSFIFNVSGLSNGLYFLEIDTGNEKNFQKLIIQH